MEIAILTLFTFLAAIVGTITSFGTSTFMVPVLWFFYPLGPTLLFTGIIHWFGNIWKIYFFRSGIRWKLILLFGIPGIISSYFGAKLVPNISEAILSRSLGIFFILYVVFLLKNSNWTIPASGPAAIIGWILSGFSSGIFGVGGAIRAAFLTAFNLKKEVFIFTAGMIGLFVDSWRIVTYILDGIVVEDSMLLGLLFIIPASFLGWYIGKYLSKKIPQEKFRNVIAIALLLIGIKYIFWI